MRTKKIFQSWSMLLLLVIIFALLQEGLAQDEDNTGVSGIADTANNFNVPAIPPQEEVTNIVNTPAPSASDTFTGFDMTATVATPPPNSLITIATGHALRPSAPFAKIMPTLATFRRQTNDIIYESSNDDGDVMIVFEDYSLVAMTAEGQEYFNGYLTLNSAGSIVIVGTDTKGYQYVFDDDYVMGLTVKGNVFMGIAELLYFYDYDEDGNFLALSDSDGNEYEVEFDDDGNINIMDAEGNIGEFYADGTFAIYDEDGNILEEGVLLTDLEADDESSSRDEESDEEDDDGSNDDSDADDEPNGDNSVDDGGDDGAGDGSGGDDGSGDDSGGDDGSSGDQGGGDDGSSDDSSADG